MSFGDVFLIMLICHCPQVEIDVVITTVKALSIVVCGKWADVKVYDYPNVLSCIAMSAFISSLGVVGVSSRDLMSTLSLLVSSHSSA